MNPDSFTILGTRVDFLSREDLYRKILHVKQAKPLFVITANAEFLLEASINREFSQVMQKADLVLPDGVSLFEARDFLDTSSKNPLILFFRGVSVGVKTLIGKYGKNRVTGVEILQELLQKTDSYKILLLGGYHGISKILAEKYHTDYYEGPNDITKITQKEDNAIIGKINSLRPDFLFVSFGHLRQEHWISQNLDKIRVGTVIGVGSAFDEVGNVGMWTEKTPEIVKNIGLKWLWRLLKNPRHVIRVWNAVIIFPLKIYFSKIV